MTRDFAVFDEQIVLGRVMEEFSDQTAMLSIKSLGGLTRGRWMGESTRNIWISTLHNCAAKEETMRQVTKTTR